MHIDSVIEDNYHRIKDDISMTLQSHGIGVEVEPEAKAILPVDEETRD